MSAAQLQTFSALEHLAAALEHGFEKISDGGKVSPTMFFCCIIYLLVAARDRGECRPALSRLYTSKTLATVAVAVAIILRTVDIHRCRRGSPILVASSGLRASHSVRFMPPVIPYWVCLPLTFGALQTRTHICQHVVHTDRYMMNDTRANALSLVGGSRSNEWCHLHEFDMRL